MGGEAVSRYEDFFVFGVVRDPVDWLLSLYNSHSKPDFDGHLSPGILASWGLR